jgi:hypothetical protein
MTFNMRPHRAFDVCSEGEVMALVEEEGLERGNEHDRTVSLVYRPESSCCRVKPRLVHYQPPCTPFLPADVLFFRQVGSKLVSS